MSNKGRRHLRTDTIGCLLTYICVVYACTHTQMYTHTQSHTQRERGGEGEIERGRGREKFSVPVLCSSKGFIEVPVLLLHVQWAVSEFSLTMGNCCPFVKSNLQVLAIVCVVCGFPGTSFTTNSIIYNPFLVLKASFGDRRWPAGSLVPPLFGDFL